MEPYYQDDTIQIVQFKGPTELAEVQQALAQFLGDATAVQPRFLLELQRAKFNFGTDDASEFFLFAEQSLDNLGGRQVVVIIDPEEQQREPTARLIVKLGPKISSTPNFAIAGDLAEAHDCFSNMASQADDSSVA